MDHIIDASGRLGVITERREGGVFARPANTPYVVGNCITATWWRVMPDGTLNGKWYDSSICDPFISARVV